MNRYVRADDRIITSDKVTHKLTQDICCAGHMGTLNKGSYVRIGKEWINYYGHWVDIISERGLHYSIRPDEVEKVTEELPQADTIKDLCDGFYIDYKPAFDQIGICKGFEYFKNQWYHFEKKPNAYGFIKTDKGFIYVAKLNEQGELVLL